MINLQEQYKIVDVFNSAYWSGVDVSIYAGNIHLEEAIQINYVISEQFMPFWAYNSYVATRARHGTRIIAGELSLNFKRDSYTYSLINLLKKQSGNYDKFVTVPKQVSTNNDTYRPPAKFINAPWGPVDSVDKLSNGELAAAFVKSQKSKTNDSAVNLINSDIYQSNGLFDTGADGFDLTIVMGGQIDASQILKTTNNGDNYFADMAIIDDKTKMNPSTGKKLLKAHIISSSISMSDDGRNFVETYAFQALDVVPLTNSEIAKVESDKDITTARSLLAQ